ncbi:MAG: ABC transporter permease [Candidatus Thermoplasmatota archaeon]|nr:ABC transporter permease [Candidatus Thermoplasmatota archaeon]MCL5963333.1 ABC transporter permease [Candidatus Thermoplasmatota archaeon]
MKPIIYEIKRTLTSKTVIIILLLIVLFSLVLGYALKGTLSSANPNAANVVNLDYAYSIKGSNYNLVTYSSNGYGEPVHDVSVSISYNNSTYTATSNKAGYANLTLPVITGKYSIPTINYSYDGNTISRNIAIYANSIDTMQGIYQVTEVINPANTGAYSLNIFYYGHNGTQSGKVDVYYKIGKKLQPGVSGGGTASTGNASESNMVYLTSINKFYTANIPLNLPSSADGHVIYIAFFNTNASILPVNSNMPALLEFSYTTISAGKIKYFAYEGLNGLFDFFIPLMAIMVGYFTYGKDKASGTLDSVLSKPITREGLFTSRFFSNIIAIFIAITIGTAVIDLFANYYLGFYMSLTSAVLIIATFTAMAAAYLGIIYILSHLIKSVSALLGSSIVIFLVFALFWGVIIDLVNLAMGNGTGSIAYTQTAIYLSSISPSSLYTLMLAVKAGTLSSISGATGTPSQYGITYLSVSIIAIIWAVVPYITGLFISKKMD